MIYERLKVSFVAFKREKNRIEKERERERKEGIVTRERKAW